MGEGVIDAEGGTGSDDLGFGHVHQWGMDLKGVGFDADFGGEVGGLGEGGNELGAAIGVSGIVDGVDAEEKIGGAECFGIGQCDREEHQVAGGDIGDGDIGHGRFVAVFGDLGVVVGEGRSAEGADVEREGSMRGRAEVVGDLGGGIEFVAMALAIVKGDGVAGVVLVASDGQDGGAVESAGEEDDGGFGVGWRVGSGHGEQ